MASWATLQFESPFFREASIFCWFFELALPCCKNHCRRSSSVGSIKSSIFYGSHWSSPLSTESLILFFLVPLFFCPYLHFAHEDARSQKSKDPSMFFSSSDPSHPLKKMEIKRNEQKKWRRSNGSKTCWREIDPSARTSNATASQGFRLRHLNKPLLICKLLFLFFVFVRCSCFRNWLGLLLFTTNSQKVRVFLFGSRGAIVPLAWNATFGKPFCQVLPLSQVLVCEAIWTFKCLVWISAYCSDLRGFEVERLIGDEWWMSNTWISVRSLTSQMYHLSTGIHS